MAKNEPKLASCSSDEIEHLLTKLGGFITRDSKHNTWVEHTATGKKGGFPRRPKSKPVCRAIVKAFVNHYLVRELGYTKAEIYKHLKC